ncbi:MAG: CbiX/SirB N-terminal domain-containing protein [Burkholderiales bacterium]|nr:CbiX/SirB N-terminal domain-containing protein [Burkholderiales bacterium]
MTTYNPQKGIVLFAHGSRDPLWHKPMEAVARQIAFAQPGAAVACAYLELSTPDLPTAVATLVHQGVNCITIVPMFLGVGKHAREDLPVLARDLQQQYPDLPITLQPAVGENLRLIALLADIALDGV